MFHPFAVVNEMLRNFLLFFLLSLSLSLSLFLPVFLRLTWRTTTLKRHAEPYLGSSGDKYLN